MSDTDDTDDLLLIPPDFFLVHSEPEPPYYSIVDSLIKQVSNLQNRIEGIESMSDVSLISNYPNHLSDGKKNSDMLHSKNSHAKRYYSHDDLYQSSIQSTPQKLHEKVRLNSLPNTPTINRFSPRKTAVKFSSPQQKVVNNNNDNDEVLQEIDTFISNVKTLQRNRTVRNLEKDFNSIKSTNTHDPNKYIEHNQNLQSCAKDLEETIYEIDKRSEKLAAQRQGTERRENAVQERVNRVNAWQCGDDVGSVPDLGVGFRDQLYRPKDTKEVPLKQSYFKSNYLSGSTTTDFNSTTTTLDKTTDSSSESTQLTAYNKLKKQEEFDKFNQNPQKEQRMYKVTSVDKVDPHKVDQERNELLHSPLHDNALTVLNTHKKISESTSAAVKETRVPKKRGINTLSDNLCFLNLADIWGSGHITSSPNKLSQKLQEENLRRQHCEQLIQDLQNRNLELQQKLAVALTVDDTKNKTIQQFREALDKVSERMEVLNEEKMTWEMEMARLKNQHSIELESTNQKILYYEKEASKSLNIAHVNQEKMTSLEKRCSELQATLEQIEVKFKEVQTNYEKEFERNKQLASIISQKEIELKENKSVLNNAREEVSHSRKAVEVCQNEFTALKDECSRLQSELREDKHTILNLSDQKRKLTSDIQTYKQNEKVLKEALEQSKLKIESTKVELRNFYQGQLEIIVENKRKEMQAQLDQEKKNNLEEIKRKELSMAKTAANHIKEISEKCALETKLLEQKHQEEIRLYQMQLSQKQQEVENLQRKVTLLPEKRAQIAKELQKVMETQWNEALKMITGTPSPINNDQNFPSNRFSSTEEVDHRQKRQMDHRKDNFESVSDYDETPVSSRGVKQTESEIQKYINMLLNRPPGNPMGELQNSKVPTNQQESNWNPGGLENQNRYDNAATRQSTRERKSGKPAWK